MYILFEDRQSFQFMIYFSELVHQFVFYIIFFSFKGNVDPNSEVVNLVESMLVDENFKHNQQASLFISIYYTLLGFREGIEKN